jgi:threonine synthase
MNGSPEAPGATIGVIERYREYLPVTEATPVVSLSEGSTSLIYSPRLSAILGRGCRVYLKHEGLNPTGSFKDRGMTVAVSKAAELGARLVICASTGNTSAAAAAYAARAGIQCAVFLPSGKIAMGKLAQAFIYGAVVIALDGNFDQCLKLVRELATEPGISVVNSINPYRLEGQKTAALETRLLIGGGMSNTIDLTGPPGFLECSDSKQPARRRFTTAASSSIRKPQPPPFGLAIRPAGIWPMQHFKNPAGPLRSLPTKRYLPPKAGWHPMKVCL